MNGDQLNNVIHSKIKILITKNVTHQTYQSKKILEALIV